jgi:hypothetical protein
MPNAASHLARAMTTEQLTTAMIDLKHMLQDPTLSPDARARVEDALAAAWDEMRTRQPVDLTMRIGKGLQ